MTQDGEHPADAKHLGTAGKPPGDEVSGTPWHVFRSFTTSAGVSLSGFQVSRVRVQADTPCRGRRKQNVWSGALSGDMGITSNSGPWIRSSGHGRHDAGGREREHDSAAPAHDGSGAATGASVMSIAILNRSGLSITRVSPAGWPVAGSSNLIVTAITG